MSTATDTSAALQQAIRSFTARYEQHAYLVYNLALRITCERELAIAAAERAFLTRPLVELDEHELVAATVTAAVATAPRKPSPDGAGDAESEACLRAAARLAPPERAALALSGLWDADPAQAGAAMGLTEDQAGRLVTTALDRFADMRAIAADEADGAYREWLWAPPPDELWDRVYAGFHASAAAAVKTDHDADSEPTVVIAADEVRHERARARGGRRRRRAFTIALVLPALLVVAAVAYTQLRPATTHKPSKPATLAAAEPTEPDASLPPVAQNAPPGDKVQALLHRKHKPLTPQQIDRLRLSELNALRVYSKRQTDLRLSKAQRDYAAKKVTLLRQLAVKRADAARRAKQLAREQRRRRHANSKQTAPLEVVVQQQGTTGGSGQTNGGGSSGGSGGTTTTSDPQNQSQAQQNCLYDADNGTYICQK